jgi:hypothetical protein
VLLTAVTVLLFATPASADLTHGVDDVTARTSARVTTKSSHGKPSGSLRLRSAQPQQASGKAQASAARAAEVELKREIAAYTKSLDRWMTCLSQSQATAGRSSSSCPEPGSPPFRATLPAMLGTGAAASPGAVQVTVTPEQVAYVAFARLHLEPLKPVIGPPPEINRWKIAAVGYPLWLSAGGNPNPPAVFDQVYNLGVRLEAHATHVDFVMGDGNVVTCEGSGLRWTPAVKPGEKSPKCGYQYSKPSLPDGKYTVTARTHWDVDWTINNQTGVIQMSQTSSVELPVGELQVLIR